MQPHAREDRLLVTDVGEELVIYDQDRHRAHQLNRAAALVWRRCDGATEIADLSAMLAEEVGLPADESTVWLALTQLDRLHLLREPLVEDAQRRPSRRAAIRALGLAGALRFLLPAVTSIVAPTPAMGQYAPQGHCGDPMVSGSVCSCPDQGTCTQNCNCKKLAAPNTFTCHCE